MEIERLLIIYKIDKNFDNLKILGENFVKNNGNKVKIIFNHKKISLREFIQINDYKEDILKIGIISCLKVVNHSYNYLIIIMIIMVMKMR